MAFNTFDEMWLSYVKRVMLSRDNGQIMDKYYQLLDEIDQFNHKEIEIIIEG